MAYCKQKARISMVFYVPVTMFLIHDQTGTNSFQAESWIVAESVDKMRSKKYNPPSLSYAITWCIAFVKSKQSKQGYKWGHYFTSWRCRFTVSPFITATSERCAPKRHNKRYVTVFLWKTFAWVVSQTNNGRHLFFNTFITERPRHFATEMPKTSSKIQDNIIVQSPYWVKTEMIYVLAHFSDSLASFCGVAFGWSPREFPHK